MRVAVVTLVAACWLGEVPEPRAAAPVDWVSCIERFASRHPIPKLDHPEVDCIGNREHWFCQAALFEALSIRLRWWIDRAIAVCSRSDL